MCDPVSMGITMAIGAGVSLMGSMQQANAAKANQQAIINQNRATQLAQNEAFNTRIQAGMQQTQAQTEAARETLDARNAATTQMRNQQMEAQTGFRDTLAAENAQADQLRKAGDTASQDLLAKTNAQAQMTAQQAREAQGAALIQQGQQETGPGPSDPNGSVGRDPATQAALARRTAEAATNVRDYGSKIAKVGGYGAPVQQVGQAIAANQTGIMPAQFAEKLLRGGSDVRLLPSKVNFEAATTMGAAQDALLQSRGQSALDTAGLSYGNATDIANLKQSNATTLASNEARQAQANAEARAAQGRVIQGIGNLAVQAGGYFGGGKGISDLFAGPTSNSALQSYGVQSGPNNPFTTYRS